MEKISFGQFLAECRTKKGLTQKELADQLFVGESAVSKWEKDRRRPDLELVTKLSEIFGITETELIKASIDKTRIKEKQQARRFRIINNVYNLILLIGFGIALLACFIVNLAVSHNLSWFFIVLCAIILAGVILLLPQYIKKHKLLIIPLSWLLGLYLLLGVICIYTNGNWFLVPMFALLFAYSIIFTPLIIKTYLPAKLKKHNAFLSIAINAVILFLLLLIIDLYIWQNGAAFGWCFTKGLPIELFWLVPIFATVVILRYAKINWPFKTSGITAIWLVMYNVFMYGFGILLNIETNNGKFWQANLSGWSTEALITANIMLIVNVAILIAALGFAALGYIFFKRNTKNKQ